MSGWLSADRLDLATVDDLVPEPEENVLDLAHDLRERVQATAPQRRTGQRHVQHLVELGELGPLELGLARVEGGLEPFSCGIERHPALAVTHAPERLLQLALTSEVPDARVVQRRARGRGRDRALSFALEGLDVHGGDCNGSFLHAFLLRNHRGRTTATPRFGWRIGGLRAR